jgi:DNA-directed RNA polymerase subunit K/omega
MDSDNEYYDSDSSASQTPVVRQKNAVKNTAKGDDEDYENYDDATEEKEEEDDESSDEEADDEDADEEADDDEDVDEDEDLEEDEDEDLEEDEDEYGDDENEDADVKHGGAGKKPKAAAAQPKPKKKKAPAQYSYEMEEGAEDDAVQNEDDFDDEDDRYLEKFDSDLVKSYVSDFHPECLSHNYDEIAKMSAVIRNESGIIIDPLHKTIPFLTKYEKARILGQRAKQIETGSKPFVKVPENIIDSHIIAQLELREKKIPFIIRRPIPGGGCEYWKLMDLEII